MIIVITSMSVLCWGKYEGVVEGAHGGTNGVAPGEGLEGWLGGWQLGESLFSLCLFLDEPRFSVMFVVPLFVHD